MYLCKYKDIFGKPETGAHAYRLLGFAFIDAFLTLLVAIIISLYYKFDFLQFTGLLFIFILLGIFFHRLFCVNTTLNKLLFGKI